MSVNVIFLNNYESVREGDRTKENWLPHAPKGKDNQGNHHYVAPQLGRSKPEVPSYLLIYDT